MKNCSLKFAYVRMGSLKEGNVDAQAAFLTGVDPFGVLTALSLRRHRGKSLSAPTIHR